MSRCMDMFLSQGLCSNIREFGAVHLYISISCISMNLWMCSCKDYAVNLISDHTCACEHVTVSVQFIICKGFYLCEGICKNMHDGGTFTCEWICKHVHFFELVNVYIYFWVNALRYVNVSVNVVHMDVHDCVNECTGEFVSRYTVCIYEHVHVYV